MNAQSKNVAKFPWVKVGLIIGVVVLVGIFSGREGIEDMFGLEPGTLGGTAVAEREKDKDPGAPHADLESDKHTGETHHDSTSESDKRNSNPQPKFELKRDGFVMKSPEGLTYYVGDRGENRIDHVMRHAKDSSSRAVHGVFTGSCPVEPQHPLHPLSSSTTSSGVQLLLSVITDEKDDLLLELLLEEELSGGPVPLLE